MPKDEFDFEDPLELNGVGILTNEDTAATMAECFVEEFMMLGYSHKQILTFFRNPHYTGMNMVVQNKGEDFVKGIISETFARWGKPFEWAVVPAQGRSPEEPFPNLEEKGPNGSNAEITQAAIGALTEAKVLFPDSLGESHGECDAQACSEQTVELDSTATDPMGNPVPKLL